MQELENDLWSFSLRVYGAPGVAERCLWLQDRRGLDVNVLLFCLWCGLGRQELDAELMAEADRTAREWSSAVVQGLRAARRGLAETGHDELRAEVKRAELAAEKIEQQQLERLARRLPARESTGDVARARTRRNLELYLETAGVTVDAEGESRLAYLIDAAQPAG